MLKIFLVEDEFIIREGIKKLIDWNAHGYEFCGEASDGEMAFPMIQKLKPDIVITDIKMPFMDGLTLSSLVKKELPSTEIIILTGHEKFEYAKEAIRIGVAQYLSKPINSQELLKHIEELAVKINERRREEQIKEKYALEMEENTRKEYRELFLHLVTASKPVNELIEMAGSLSMDLSAIKYSIMLFCAGNGYQAGYDYSVAIAKIENEIGEMEKRYDILVFDRQTEGIAILLKADSDEDMKKLKENITEEIERIMGESANIRYFGGIGSTVGRLSELPQSFERAERTFANRYFITGNCIQDSERMQTENVKEEAIDLGNIDAKEIDKGRIREFLRAGHKNEVIYFTEEFFDKLKIGAMKSNIFRQYITMDAYFCVVSFVEEINHKKEEIEALDMTSDICGSVSTAIDYIVRIISKAIELRDMNVCSRYDDIVSNIKKYVEENYADDELSLNQIAIHMNFSPNHLSMVFSQQTGQTFIKYLTDFRMGKAKEMLRCTGKKSSEIAYEVGYKDSHYFSYLFKKTQNITPTQYRDNKGSRGDEKC